MRLVNTGVVAAACTLLALALPHAAGAQARPSASSAERAREQSREQAERAREQALRVQLELERQVENRETWARLLEARQSRIGDAAARDSTTTAQLRALEAELQRLERLLEEFAARMPGEESRMRLVLMDSVMQLRGQELRVRARSLALAHALRLARSSAVVTRESSPASPAARGWLGVSFEGGLVEETGRGAVLVATDYPQIFSVSPGSPAAQAGLRRGDRILTIEGVDVRREPMVLDDVFRPGRNVQLRVERGGERRQVQVSVTERPERWVVMREMPDSALIAELPRWGEPWARMFELQGDADWDWSGLIRFPVDSAFRQVLRQGNVEQAVASALVAERTRPGPGERGSIRVNVRTSPDVRPRVMTWTDGVAATPFVMLSGDLGYAFGARLTTLSPMLRGELNAPEGGVLVLEVASASPAERAGLRPLDVLVRADGKLIENPASIARAVSAREGKSLRLELVRRGKGEVTVVRW